ncbi:MAG: class I SAM-dependent methyltransferase [Myxococcota bacterium]|nr:class I SAM-dependent methyltransferase [Myxococcota bacterium]
MDLEAQRRSLGASFDAIAALYDEARPRHPEALVEHVVRTAGIGPGSALLEIGAGPGIATRPFAERGCEITCLEPGAALAARCRSQLSGYPVRVLETTFEAWPLEPQAFDLVFAAQAFHWTDPATAYDRAASALRPGGWIAIFGNMPLAPPETDVARAVQEAYARHASSLSDRRLGKAHGHGDYALRLSECAGFEAPQARVFPWQARYEAEPYTRLLTTHSDHQALDADVRAALLAAVRRAIDEHGGVYEVHYEARLWMARRVDERGADR